MLLKRTEPRSVAAMRHTGPFDEIPATVMRLTGLIANEGYAMTGPLMAVYYDSPDEVLTEWAERNQYKIVGPPVEVYWSDPMTVPEERLVTEVWFPVEEKKVPGIAR